MASKAARAVEKHHSSGNRLADFILGCQDGLVNVLGILLGLSAATSNLTLIFVAAFAALGTESVSMGAVAYTSTLARRKEYLKERENEEREIRDVPQTERGEVREIFRNWGYSGGMLERATEVIVSNPKAWLEFMMSYELQLRPIDESEPRRSFLIVLGSTVVGSFVPVVPYLLLGGGNLLTTAIASVILSGIVLFYIGYYEARTTVGSLGRSGLQMALIGLGAGFAGFLIGHFIGAPP